MASGDSLRARLSDFGDSSSEEDYFAQNQEDGPVLMDEYLSPEIPLQDSNGQEQGDGSGSDSSDNVPNWCYKEGVAQRTAKRRRVCPRPLGGRQRRDEVDRPQQVAGSTSGGEQVTRSDRRELSEIKSLLNTLCETVEENSRSLKALQASASQKEASSSSSSKESRKVPPAVRLEVRKTYQVLMDEDENFPGWLTGPGKTIRESQNQAVLNKLIKEVKSLNQTFDVADIRAAAYRFYRSRAEEDSRQRRGKAEGLKLIKRRYERIVRKRKERSTAVMRNKRLTEEHKDKWLAVITNDFMSSEESGPDDDIYVHPLPWKSDYVTKMFNTIDNYVQKKKSPQAKRQTKKRIVAGLPSERPQPKSSVPEWAMKQDM